MKPFNLSVTHPKLTQQEVDDLTYKAIGACIEVHKEMKAGLKEAIYEECLTIELASMGLSFRQQFSFRPTYKGHILKTRSVTDLIIEDLIVLELKAVAAITPLHMAQANNYINLLGLPKAVVVNFNCHNITSEGKKTTVNDVYAGLY